MKGKEAIQRTKHVWFCVVWCVWCAWCSGVSAFEGANRNEEDCKAHRVAYQLSKEQIAMKKIVKRTEYYKCAFELVPFVVVDLTLSSVVALDQCWQCFRVLRGVNDNELFHCPTNKHG
jgi:hypothetical protein